MADELNALSGPSRVVVGGLGGLAAVGSKYLGQDHDFLVQCLRLQEDTKLVMAPILIFLGALVAWAVHEDNRLKLLAIAVAAPAMITTWAGGESSSTKLAVISPAMAEERSDLAQTVGIVQGVKLFFGVGKTTARLTPEYTGPDRYRVVIGAFATAGEAQEFVQQVKSEDPTLELAVVESELGSEVYAVTVGGGWLPLLEAVQFQNRAKELGAVENVYLIANWSPAGSRSAPSR